jgi:hypothetical protein
MTMPCKRRGDCETCGGNSQERECTPLILFIREGEIPFFFLKTIVNDAMADEE